MLRPLASFLALCLLLAGSAAAQTNARQANESKSKAVKTFTIAGKVSPDGKLVTAKDGENWSVTNPGTLVGHEGQLLKVKYQLAGGDHKIQVMSLKVLAAQTKYAVNRGDSVFRR